MRLAGRPGPCTDACLHAWIDPAPPNRTQAIAMNHEDDTLPDDVERLLAATLALMTTFYRCPHVAVCRKLLDNLALLARHPGLSDPLRTVCRNAQARWASTLEEVEQAIAAVDGDIVQDEPETQPATLH